MSRMQKVQRWTAIVAAFMAAAFLSVSLTNAESFYSTGRGASSSSAVDPSNAVYVDQQATGGTGSSGDPWTGWDTAITWAAHTQYRFPKGYYSYATSPNFCLEGLSLVGESQTGTILKYTGTGKAVNFTAGAGTWVFGMNMENFTIQGNGTTSDQGLYLSGIRGSTFRNITIKDFVTDAFYAEACVTNVVDNLYVPRKTYVTLQPKNGVQLNARAGDGSQTTTFLFNNLIVEGASEKGIYIKNAFWNSFNEGTAEGLDGKGLVIDANGGGVLNDGNVFINFDFETNCAVAAQPQVEIRSSRQQFLGCNADGTTRIYSGSAHKLSGGHYHSITLDAGVNSQLDNLYYSGTFTDAGSNMSIRWNVIDESGTGLPIKSKLPPNSPTWQSLSGAATVNTNANLGDFFILYADQNFTLATPTNGTLGQRVTWRIQQDATGSRLITLGAGFRAGPWTVTLSTVATKVDYLEAVYNSTDDKWDIVNFQKGY